ncbi:MAG: metallophosphoesterase, partial [Thermomicrobiales bacterium]
VVDVRARLEQVAIYLRGLAAPPDVIVLTGDIIQGNAVAGYAVAHNLLAEITPVFPCLGNSDKRQPLREALLGDIGAGEGDEPVNYWCTAGAVTLSCLIPAFRGNSPVRWRRALSVGWSGPSPISRRQHRS